MSQLGQLSDFLHVPMNQMCMMHVPNNCVHKLTIYLLFLYLSGFVMMVNMTSQCTAAIE